MVLVLGGGEETNLLPGCKKGTFRLWKCLNSWLITSRAPSLRPPSSRLSSCTHGGAAEPRPLPGSPSSPHHLEKHFVLLRDNV